MRKWSKKHKNNYIHLQVRASEIVGQENCGPDPPILYLLKWQQEIWPAKQEGSIYTHSIYIHTLSSWSVNHSHKLSERIIRIYTIKRQVGNNIHPDLLQYETAIRPDLLRQFYSGFLFSMPYSSLTICSPFSWSVYKWAPKCASPFNFLVLGSLDP